MIEPDLKVAERTRTVPSSTIRMRVVRSDDDAFPLRPARLEALLLTAGDGALPLDLRWRCTQVLVDELDRAFAQEGSRDSCRALFAQYDRSVHEALIPSFAAHGRRFARWTELSAARRRVLRGYFRRSILPLLTPTVVDRSHPFPRLPTLGVNLAVSISPVNGYVNELACVPVPVRLPRALAISTDSVVLIEDVITASLGELFVGVDLIDAFCFRVTHAAEQPSVARLEVDRATDHPTIARLARQLGVADEADILTVRSTVSMGQVWQLHGSDPGPATSA